MKFDWVMLLCIIASSIPDTLMKVLMPKLNITTKISSLAEGTKKLPEDRRQLAIFPKKIRKFTILPMSYYKVHTTHNPIVPASQQPLMRKLVLQDKRYEGNNIMKKRVTRRRVMNTNLRFAKRLNVFRTSTPRKYKVNELEEKKYSVSNFNDTDKTLNGDYTDQQTLQVYTVDFQVHENTRENIEKTKPIPDARFINATNNESLTSPNPIHVLESENSIENCLQTSSEAPTYENENIFQEFTFKINGPSTEVTSENSKEFAENTEKTTLPIDEITQSELLTTEDISKENTTFDSTSENQTFKLDVETTEVNFEPIQELKELELPMSTTDYVDLRDNSVSTSDDPIQNQSSEIIMNENTDIDIPADTADQYEFIFINRPNKITGQEESDLHLADDADMTTEVLIDSKLRKNRGANVIEEEILPST